MSASVVLDGIWVGPVTDPSSSIRFYGHAVPHGSGTRRGAVQEFSDNYQSWARPGHDETFVMRFTVVPRDDVETLDSWTGRTLLLRDLKGAKEFVTFFEFQWQDIGRGHLEQQVDITFSRVSFEEEI